MTRLAGDLGWRRGIELGLGNGHLFARFLGMGIDMIGVDLGVRRERRVKVSALGGTVHWMSTEQAAGLVPDGWADFVFIDAGHSYEAVANDIRLWQRKVKPGGWFGGHDYNDTYRGVIRAVDEAFGGAIVLLPGYVWARE